ncbi:hypothetical protein E1161_26340 [Saccharopolyspora aridisoli]|uniref:Uncharacterized protein n=1 Tax=Saccharopolyspora aridisoli TaxID=2530385 RepID=A0A4R4UJX1_9PSEU|nr:hypothetical protein [Saccharopolyspora aridisoli]TDC87089.1 hypothetical protein E1161_26340 [Saccharopolyspora aridisoli]
MRTGAFRWALLVALALGVVLMHHVPAQHHSHHAGHVGVHAQVEASDDAAPDGHDALHLCLAIAASFLVLLAPRLRMAAVVTAEMFVPRIWRTLQRARPPDPSPRRLAALCVLRR